MKLTIRQWLNKNYSKHSSPEALVAAGTAALGVGKTSFLNSVAGFKKNVIKSKAAKK